MLFKREINPREIAIEFMRQIDADEYKKVIKIVEIKRQSDEDVAVVEAGSKKALKELEKEDADISKVFEDL